MPHYDNNNLHGNLYITFDVEFPKEAFSEEHKESKFSIFCASQYLKILYVTLMTLSERNLRQSKINTLISALKKILKQKSINNVYNGLRDEL